MTINERVTQKLPASAPAAVSCRVCGEGVRMIPVEQAAHLCRVSRRRVYRWVEEGVLHYLEQDDDTLLVCGRCLSRHMDLLADVTRNLSDARPKEQ